MNVGEPDFPPPQEVADAIAAALKAGHTRFARQQEKRPVALLTSSFSSYSYVAVQGLPELRAEIARYMTEKRGASYVHSITRLCHPKF